jgi:ribosome-associated heat shock protein Hsp15
MAWFLLYWLGNDYNGPTTPDNNMAKQSPPATTDSLRLDKWLWAARFFKTRGLAVDAISGGKVYLDGQRVKPARPIRVGMELRIRQGDVEKTVVVRGLNTHRRPAKEAVLLYRETDESIAAREQSEELRRSAGIRERGTGRPTKRDRRNLQRLKE